MFLLRRIVGSIGPDAGDFMGIDKVLGWAYLGSLVFAVDVDEVVARFSCTPYTIHWRIRERFIMFRMLGFM